MLLLKIIKNKSKNFIYLFSSFCFFIFVSCITRPIEESYVLQKTNNFEEDSNLKIYFPQFTNELGNIYEGDGIVIIFPDKTVFVLDGFVKEATPKFIDFLNQLEIKKIDYLTASHFHADHIGSFSEIINNFEVSNFYSNGIPINTSISNNLIDLLGKKNIKHSIFHESESFTIDKCKLQFFGPIISDQEKYDAFYNPGKTAKLINNTSLFFKLNYNDFSILFTGDMYKSGINKIIKKYKNKIKAKVLKVPHHGDWATTNTLFFIKKVSPEYSIIQDNRYINPIISFRYKVTGSKLIYKNTNGYILLETNGMNYTISNFEIN